MKCESHFFGNPEADCTDINRLIDAHGATPARAMNTTNDAFMRIP